MPGPAFRSADGTELRAIESEDHAFIAEKWNSRDVRLPTNTNEPMTAGDVAAAVDSDESVNFVVCADGERVGAAWLFGVKPLHGRGELGYWVADGHRGEGHATAAARLLVEYAVAEQRLRKLTARVFEGNEASERVLEKVGFEEEGLLRDHYYIDGEWLDATLYAYFAE